MIDVDTKEIKINDFIIFSVVHDRTARLRFGKVTKLNEKTVSVKAYSIDLKMNWERLEDDKTRYWQTTEVKNINGSFNYPELKSFVVPFEVFPKLIQDQMIKDGLHE